MAKWPRRKPALTRIFHRLSYCVSWQRNGAGLFVGEHGCSGAIGVWAQANPVGCEALGELVGYVFAGGYGEFSIGEPGIGRVYGAGFQDPPKTDTIESQLRNLIWVNDVALGGDYIVNYDIHAIGAALWVIGANPTAATGASRICRTEPHGDLRDVCSVVFDFDDGLVLNHASVALLNAPPGNLSCLVYGTEAHAQLNYWGQGFVKGGPKETEGGTVDDLYNAGAIRNIATFHDDITHQRFDNPTVRRSVDGCLATILAREAAARRTRMTMDELLKENKRLEVDLSGLQI